MFAPGDFDCVWLKGRCTVPGDAPILLPRQHKEVDLSRIPAAARMLPCAVRPQCCAGADEEESSSISNEGVRSKLSQEAEIHGFPPYHCIPEGLGIPTGGWWKERAGSAADL